MIKKVFTIYDEKAEAYLQPFFFDTVGQALRAVGELVNDPTHQFGKHTEDYVLFQCAEFDEHKAIFVTGLHSLGSLLELKRPSNVLDMKIGGTK